MLYELYGLPVESPLRLSALPLKTGKPAVTIVKAPSFFLKRIIPESPELLKGVCYLPLADGAVYIRFFQFFRFWVSPNGRRILYEKIPSQKSQKAPSLSPLIFLQTNVFSFSLLKLGVEAFHASSVALGDKAVAFLGESGYGKSTLAASFLRKGFPLLTDDVLAIREKDGRFFTSPGAAQIKLWPQTAKKILGRSPAGGTMSPVAKKIILPLQRKTMGGSACEVKLLYVLWPRFEKGSPAIRIRKLKPQDGVMALIKSSHNLVLQDSRRLSNQVIFASKLAKNVPIRALSFPMDLKKIPAVRDLVLRDISRICGQR